MRRSRWIAVIGLGLGGATLLTMYTGSEPTEVKPEAVVAKFPDQTTVFSDVEDCVQSVNDRQSCETALKHATEVNNASAIRYPSQVVCERIYGDGQCTPFRDDSFIPAVAGFALGGAIGAAAALPIQYDRAGKTRVLGGTAETVRGCGGTAAPGSSGQCASSASGTRTHVVLVPGGITKPGAASAAIAASVRPVTRSGFGQTVASTPTGTSSTTRPRIRLSAGG